MQYTDTDLDTMARTVWGEARGEGDLGMAAVAWVIRNRAERPGWWGGTISGVCLKKYQFSCWLPSDPNSSKCATVDESDPAFARCRDISRGVLDGLLPDPTHGATSYYERHMKSPPAWSVNVLPCAEVGNHRFYKGV